MSGVHISRHGSIFVKATGAVSPIVALPSEWTPDRTRRRFSPKYGQNEPYGSLALAEALRRASPPLMRSPEEVNATLRRENAALEQQLSGLRADVERIFTDVTQANMRELQRVTAARSADVERLTADIAELSLALSKGADGVGEGALPRATEHAVAAATESLVKKHKLALAVAAAAAASEQKEHDLVQAMHTLDLERAKLEWEDERALLTARAAEETEAAVAAAVDKLNAEHDITLAVQIAQRRAAVENATAEAHDDAAAQLAVLIERLEADANRLLEEQRAESREELASALATLQSEHDASAVALADELEAQRVTHDKALEECGVLAEVLRVVASQRAEREAATVAAAGEANAPPPSSGGATEELEAAAVGSREGAAEDVLDAQRATRAAAIADALSAQDAAHESALLYARDPGKLEALIEEHEALKAAECVIQSFVIASADRSALVPGRG